MAYVDVAEYVDTFGEQETKRITADSATDTTYDSAKVEEALADSEEVVDGYISRRYAVPLVTVPKIVKGWVKALAREALHVNTGRMTDTVQQAADRARAQLKDLIAKNMDLPIDDVGGTPPAPVSIGYAESSNDRTAPAFSGNPAFETYLDPLMYGSPLPAWRR